MSAESIPNSLGETSPLDRLERMARDRSYQCKRQRLLDCADECLRRSRTTANKERSRHWLYRGWRFEDQAVRLAAQMRRRYS